MIGNVAALGESGRPSRAQRTSPPLMEYASKPAARKACAAISEREPDAAVEDHRPLAVDAVPPRDDSWTSSMWRVPSMCPASRS